MKTKSKVKVRSIESQFNRKTRSFGSNFWKRNQVKLELGRIRQEVLLVLDKKCKYCSSKLTIANVSLDHIIPKSQGGTHSWDNLQFICSVCNSTKGTLSHEFFVIIMSLKEKYPHDVEEVCRRLKMSNLFYGGRRK